jgi:hypothetical protein
VGGGGSYFHMINYPGVGRRNKIEMCCSRTPSNFDRLLFGCAIWFAPASVTQDTLKYTPPTSANS